MIVLTGSISVAISVHNRGSNVLEHGQSSWRPYRLLPYDRGSTWTVLPVRANNHIRAQCLPGGQLYAPLFRID